MDNSRTNATQQEGDERIPRAAQAPAESRPQFRSVAMMSPPSAMIGDTIPRPIGLAGRPTSKNNDVIDKAAYFSTPSQTKQSTQVQEIQSNWAPTQLRTVPAFYPLERSTRLVEDPLSDVVARVSEANRVLSVHAAYCDETATASLLTAENVEMQLSLWKTGGSKQPEVIAVELQRRKGDSIAFHRYSRHILDAAVGDFDPQRHIETHGVELDVVYSKKVQRMLNLETMKEATNDLENAIIAIEIAHGLLKKDRMDARQLGLESLCLLTDPNKTGKKTALIASRVVVLGTSQDPDAEDDGEVLLDEGPFQDIRQTILSLIQLRRIGEEDDYEEDNAVHPEEEEHMTVLHNLALAVLANALDVIETEDLADATPDEAKVSARDRLGSASSICDSFLEEAEEVGGGNEILKTLISELGKAADKPHNACLSAKCIGCMCRASDKARRRARELGAKNVVQTALEVGTRTHLKLETECEKVMSTLNSNTQE